MEAAYSAVSTEMYDYIQINSAFASDCGEAIRQFRAEWAELDNGSGECADLDRSRAKRSSDVSVGQRSAFLRLLEYYKIMSGDRLAAVAKVWAPPACCSHFSFLSQVGNAFMSSSQFAKNRKHFLSLAGELANKLPPCWAQVLQVCFWNSNNRSMIAAGFQL